MKIVGLILLATYGTLVTATLGWLWVHHRQVVDEMRDSLHELTHRR